jgi:hypothetical protein
MKDIKSYILEKEEEKEEIPSSKKFSFNFSGLKNGEETLKSLKNEAEDKDIDIEDSDTKFSFTIKKEDVNKLDSIIDILQSYSDEIGKSSDRTNNETYAQKCKKIADSLNSLTTYIDQINNEDE